MARYTTTVRTHRSATEVFDYMTDLRNFAEWDPGVQRVEQLVGTGGGAHTEFDVTVDVPGSSLTLRYVTTEFEPPHSATVRAESRLFTSLDRVTVESEGDGALVTYDAELRLNGPLGLFDLMLKPAFDRIGGRADAGLQRVLDGEKLTV